MLKLLLICLAAIIVSAMALVAVGLIKTYEGVNNLFDDERR